MALPGDCLGCALKGYVETTLEIFPVGSPISISVNQGPSKCLVLGGNFDHFTQVKLKDSMAKDEELREELEEVKVWVNSHWVLRVHRR